MIFVNIGRVGANNMQGFTPNKSLQDSHRLSKFMKDEIAKVEDIPDYKKRQAEIVRIFSQVKDKAKDEKIKKFIDVSKAAVDIKSTISNALEIAKITQRALLNGFYTNPSLVSKVALDILDTFNYSKASDKAARGMVKSMLNYADGSLKSVFELAEDVQAKGFYTDTSVDTTIARNAFKMAMGGVTGSPAEIIKVGVEICRQTYYRNVSRYIDAMYKRVVDNLSRKDRPKAKAVFVFSKLMEPRESLDFFQEMMGKISDIPSGLKGMLYIARKSLERVIDSSLNINASDVLEALSFRVGNASKMVRLAKSIDRALKGDAVIYDEKVAKEYPNTARMVRKVVNLLDKNVPLETDKDILSFASKLLDMCSGKWSANLNGEVINGLMRYIKDPETKEALEFTKMLVDDIPEKSALISSLNLLAKVSTPLESKRDYLKFGMSLVETFEPPYNRVNGYEKLLKFVKADPELSKDARLILEMGSNSSPFIPEENKEQITRFVLNLIGDGKTDKDFSPTELAKKVYSMLDNAAGSYETRDWILDVLINEVKNPDAEELLKVCKSLISKSSNYIYAENVFMATLDKLEKYDGSKKFDVKGDTLSLVQGVSDKLEKAYMLRNVVVDYVDRKSSDGKMSKALVSPFSALSMFGKTSTEMLNKVVDSLNIALEVSQHKISAYEALKEMYSGVSDEYKSLAAVSMFAYDTNMPLKNMKEVKEHFSSKADLDIVDKFYKDVKDEDRPLKIIKTALDVISKLNVDYGRASSGVIKSALYDKGAVSFIALNELERCMGKGVLKETIEEINKELGSSDELYSKIFQNALYRISLKIINETTKGNPAIEKIVKASLSEMEKSQSSEKNQKILIKTLEDIEKFQSGVYEDVMDWTAHKIFGGSTEGRIKTIKEEEDHVVVGGVVLPKRKYR